MLNMDEQNQCFNCHLFFENTGLLFTANQILDKPEDLQREHTRLQNQQNTREKRKQASGLTSSTLHPTTWLAWMPWTPGSSLQCCSQQRDRVLSDWLLRADMNSDGYTPSEDIAEHTCTHIPSATCYSVYASHKSKEGFFFPCCQIVWRQ